MKKIVAILLTLILCASLFACTNSNADTDTDTEKPATGNNQGSYQVIFDTMNRFNCQDNAKYDKSIRESNANWIARHDGVELGNLELYGCERHEDGYRIVNADEFGIKYRVKQNLGSLVSNAGSKNGAQSLWVNNDSSVGAINTNINTAIGIGAYYIKVTYTDGKESQLSKTDFFKDAENGMLLNMLSSSDIDSQKTISSIEVTVLYESYAGAPGFLDVWWHEYTNWRCEHTYNF